MLDNVVGDDDARVGCVATQVAPSATAVPTQTHSAAQTLADCHRH
jgi:hypothetical protein